jgi:RNA-directed DNA polymerase
MEEFSMEFIQQISADILRGKFKFKPVHKDKSRKKGAVAPSLILRQKEAAVEKVVQKALFLVLNRLYEPTFQKTSHGYRTGKSCITALQYIEKAFKGVVWFIEADVSKTAIPHKSLMKVVRKKVQCEKT